MYGNMYANDKYVRKRFEYYTQLLSPYLKEGISLLDVGCYTADLINLLPKSVDYHGVDSDEEALKIAKNRGVNVFEVDLDQPALGFLKKKFDVIVVAELLEHLKDPERLITQISELLKDGGVILLSLPNECTMYHRIKVLFGRGIDGTGFAAYYHLHFPTIKQNDEFVSKHFRVLKRKFWIHVDIGGPLGRLFSMIPDAFWLILGNLWPTMFARGVIYLCQK